MKTAGWYVYMIETDQGQLYTGITTDPVRRFQEHTEGRGARYFRAVKPKTMVFCREVVNRSHASSLEMKIKRMSRAEKWRMVSLEPDLPKWVIAGIDAYTEER